MRANPRDFTSDESKILFVLLFMTEGMPKQWALDFNEGVMGAAVWNFGIWAVFKIKLRTSFEDKEKAKNTRTVLHLLKQGSRTAEDFFSQFELLR